VSRVIDLPCLSDSDGDVDKTLTNLFRSGKPVLFADECKSNQMPLSSVACRVMNKGGLLQPWRIVGALPTYNPLGTYLTFLSKNDVVESSLTLLGGETSS
jgi:hypothetical protein